MNESPLFPEEISARITHLQFWTSRMFKLHRSWSRLVLVTVIAVNLMFLWWAWSITENVRSLARALEMAADNDRMLLDRIEALENSFNCQPVAPTFQRMTIEEMKDLLQHMKLPPPLKEDFRQKMNDLEKRLDGLPSGPDA